MKIISALIFFLIICLKLSSMGIPNQFDTEKLNQFNLNQWIQNDNISAQTFLDISTTFIKFISNWLSQQNLWPKNEIPLAKIKYIYETHNYKVVENNQDYYKSDYDLNYAAKWIIPPNIKVNIIGDIHGNFKIIKENLINMHRNNFITNNFELTENNNLIFLGDYIDRGPHSLKVLTTIMLLALKNPGRVFILKGNHENVLISCLNYDLENHISKITSSVDIKNLILDRLSQMFEILPAFLLVGNYTKQNKIQYKLYSHAGLDLRLNFNEILKLEPTKINDFNEIILKEITKNDFLPRKDFINIINDFIKSSVSNENLIENFFAPTCPIFGFLWNDIYINSEEIVIKQSNRPGNDLFVIGSKFIKFFFKKLATPISKIVGIVRGHEHYLPREISNLFKTFIFFFSPPIAYTIINSNYSYSLCLKESQIFNYKNFVIITLIGGSIIDQNYNPFIDYPSMFLQIKLNNQDQYIYTPYIY
ncbi:hypothetical protein GF322_04170 [Candidatus Dependentiae bacterium]|nr:hypothetical protein [Candidatus Dependentiae bacterium]